MSIPASSSFLKPLWPLSPHRCNYCRGSFMPTAPGSSCCAEFCRPAWRGGSASHTRAHKCQGEVCHAGGLLQLSCLPARPRAPRGCRGSAPVRAHSPAEQAPDQGMAAGPVPCPAGNHEKKDQTKRKSAFQLLKEKVKAIGHLLCTHSGGNCLEHIYKGHGTF